MIRAEDLIREAPKYLGTPYSVMDCQAYVEKVLADAGIRKNLAGSNAWYRFAMQHGWVGSPEQCKKEFGKIPEGAFLFILKNDGKEPGQYKDDGIGNASHIGIYTGKTENQMMARAFIDQEIDSMEDRRALDKKAGHGSGAINSSYTWGCVATSNFEGKSINGGWNRVWLWTEMIDYSEEEEQKMGEQATVVLPAGSKGSTVNMREGPGTNYGIMTKVPVGWVVEVISDQGQWCKIQYNHKTGWMQSNYLEYDGQADETGQDELTNDQQREIAELTEIIGKYAAGILQAKKVICDIVGLG